MKDGNIASINKRNSYSKLRNRKFPITPSAYLTSSLSCISQRNITTRLPRNKKIDSVLNHYCRLLICFFGHCDLQAHVTFPSRVSDHTETEDATHVLTGLSSSELVWVLTNCATDALVLTGGGLGGCCWVCAKAGAAGEVRLTYSDRSISNWNTGANQSDQSRAHPEELYTVYRTMRRLQVKMENKRRQDDWFLKS